MWVGLIGAGVGVLAGVSTQLHLLLSSMVLRIHTQRHSGT